MSDLEDTRLVPGTYLTWKPAERVCPVCGPHRDGAVTISVPGYEGEYCLRCYARWIMDTFPRLDVKDGTNKIKGER